MQTAAAVYLGLGTNIEPRKAHLEEALLRLGRFLVIKKTSSVYQTKPLFYEDQSDFLNMAIQVDCFLTPSELLRKIKTIEKEMGRQLDIIPLKGPRQIDIDILFYGEQIINLDYLSIPHPGVAKRKFVLVPLLEIAPKFIHPQSRGKLEDSLKNLKEQADPLLFCSASALEDQNKKSI